MVMLAARPGLGRSLFCPRGRLRQRIQGSDKAQGWRLAHLADYDTTRQVQLENWTGSRSRMSMFFAVTLNAGT
jgi:hypothetical protein